MRENDHNAPPAGGGDTRGRAVSYQHSDSAQTQLIAELGSLMADGARRFCDVGGGANPIISKRKIEQLGLEYVILDDSQDELAKAPSGYHTFRASILDTARIGTLIEQRGRFDVLTSRWTAEHMPDGRRFHEQVFSMLAPGGAAVHLFPTLYSPVFVLNRLLPAGASASLLERASRGGRSLEGRHPKFRSYYSWCRGPGAAQLRRLEDVGFTVERYIGFFGHSYYRRVKGLQIVHRSLTTRLLDHPMPSLTSFALVVLRRS